MFEIWDNIDAIDVFDISILSWLIYRTLLILRGTRASQSLFGLFFLGILYILSKEWNLHGSSWLLDKFFVYIVLVVIILFQEDIRRGLARAGNIFPILQIRRETSILEEVVKACQQMSPRHIGALIAFERSASLQEYIDAGINLDARVSADLLKAIFLPTSPLHDGAVIIRGDRISCAQTFFPLTQSKGVSKVFGTRHYAAIGFTELTDAIVVVLSEERGTIAIAQNGKIKTVVDAYELRQELQKALTIETET